MITLKLHTQKKEQKSNSHDSDCIEIECIIQARAEAKQQRFCGTVQQHYFVVSMIFFSFRFLHFCLFVCVSFVYFADKFLFRTPKKYVSISLSGMISLEDWIALCGSSMKGKAECIRQSRRAYRMHSAHTHPDNTWKQSNESLWHAATVPSKFFTFTYFVLFYRF